MPTDTTIIDRLRAVSSCGLFGEAADALTAAHAALAECYRLTGADPDGDEDWRLAPHAVAEVKRLREESDAEIAAAHAARDAAERERDEARGDAITAVAYMQESDAKLAAANEELDKVRPTPWAYEQAWKALEKHRQRADAAEAALTTALRERAEARAALLEMTERERQAHAKRRP